jgi:hypothetical protein
MSEINESDPLPDVRDTAMSRLQSAHGIEKLKRDPYRVYELRVFMAAAEVKNLFNELGAILDLFQRAHSFPELTALLKLYVISWNSLSDLVAILLNEIYDLGIADHDVNFGAILRNHHIRSTEIPAAVKRHAKSTRYDHFVKLRNEIVHRGKLADEDLIAINTDLLMNLLQKAKESTLNDEDAKSTALKAAREETRTEQRVRELISKRQSENREHLASTGALLAEIAAIIVPRIQQHPI